MKKDLSLKQRFINWYESIRYEDGRWPLWYLHRNAQYILKHLFHRPRPFTKEDAGYYRRMNDYLASRSAVHSADMVRLSAVGDVMWIRSGWEKLLSPALKKHVAGSDLILANLETPIAPNHPVPRWVYETLHYNAPPEYLSPWKAKTPTSKRVFSICNNHALDQGAEGVGQTREAILSNEGFFCIGGTNHQDAVTHLQMGNLKISGFGFTFGINHLKNSQQVPQGIPLIHFGNPDVEPDWSLIERLIAQARSTHPDLIFVIPHWGFEYEYWPDCRMREHAHRLIEMGVDLVFGSSPHVIQPIELVSVNRHDLQCPVQLESPGDSRLGLIAYSLGNFSTIMPTLACQVGLLLDVELVHHSSRWLIGGLKVHPTLSSQRYNKKRWQSHVSFLAENSADPKRFAPHWQHVQNLLGALAQSG